MSIAALEKFVFTLCIVFASSATLNKKMHVAVSHEDTLISVKMTLDDISHAWKEDLNDQSSDEFKVQSYAFCSAISDLFKPVPTNNLFATKPKPVNYNGCKVTEFKIMEYNGVHIASPAVSFDLSFEGSDFREYESLVFYKLNYKKVLRINGSLFIKKDFQILKVSKVFNTHEVTNPEMNQRSDFMRNFLALVSGLQGKKLDSRSTGGLLIREVLQQMPSDKIDEDLTVLKRLLDTIDMQTGAGDDEHSSYTDLDRAESPR